MLRKFQIDEMALIRPSNSCLSLGIPKHGQGAGEPTVTISEVNGFSYMLGSGCWAGRQSAGRNSVLPKILEANLNDLHA